MLIRKKVSIDPEFLDQNYQSYLLQKIRGKYEKTCTKSTGYVVSIDLIDTIHDNVISSGDSMTVFDVSFRATVLKPSVEDVLSGKVCLITNYCILVEIHDKLKVLIPSTTMTNFKFKDGEYVSDKTVIKMHSNIKVELTKIKYEIGHYSCIGRFKGLQD